MNKNIITTNQIFDRILAIGAHPDDVELGCFGTLSKYKKQGSQIKLIVASCGGVGGEVDKRRSEALQSAEKLGFDIIFLDLKDTEIPEGQPTINSIEEVIIDFKPTAVFVHSPNDSHQDHRNVSRATISAARFVQSVFFYQTPSSTRYFNPVFFVDMSQDINTKLSCVRIHESQGKNVYMADSAVKGLAQFLGLQMYQGDKYFEGFEIHQILI